MAETLRALAEARLSPAKAATDDDITSKTAECDRKLAQDRATLDARANSDTVAPWIAEIEAEKASYALAASKPEPRRRLTEQEIKDIVDKFADVARVLIDADPDKAEIFRKLGLKLAYHPARYLVTPRSRQHLIGRYGGGWPGRWVKSWHAWRTGTAARLAAARGTWPFSAFRSGPSCRATRIWRGPPLQLRSVLRPPASPRPTSRRFPSPARQWHMNGRRTTR